MAWLAGDTYQGDGTKKTQCSASSEFSATYPATDAFDGVTGTDVDDCWISTAANAPNVDGSCYLEWDFGEKKLITGIQLQVRDAAATCRNFPEDIVVYASDTGAFAGEEILAFTGAVTGASGGGTWSDEIDFDQNVFGRYLRVEIHTMYAFDDGVGYEEDWVSVKEVQFHLYDIVTSCDIFVADVKGDKNAQLSGTYADYGYFGETDVGHFLLKYREHEPAGASYHTPSFNFTENTDGIKVEMTTTFGVGEAYLFNSFDPADIDGKYLSASVWTSALETSSEEIRVLIYDGAYDQSSSTDFPTGFDKLIKGNGLLQSVWVQNGNGLSWTDHDHSISNEPISLAAYTESQVTVFFEYQQMHPSSKYVILKSLEITEYPCAILDADLEFPAVGFSGAMIYQQLDADIEFPAVSFEGAFLDETLIGNLVIPKPTSWTELPLSGTLEFPPMTLDGVIPLRLYGDLELPRFEFFGNFGSIGDIELPSVTMQGECKKALTGGLVLPALQLSGKTGWRGETALPGVECFGEIKKLLTADIEFPIVELWGRLRNATPMETTLEFPAVILKGIVTVKHPLRGEMLTMPEVELFGELKRILSLYGDIECPTIVLTGRLRNINPLESDIEFPAVEVWGDITPPATAVSTDGLLKFHRGY